MELKFGSVDFCGEGIPVRIRGEKPLRKRDRRKPTTKSLSMLMPGFEPGSHWWEASALTTAPTLLPKKKILQMKIVQKKIEVTVFADHENNNVEATTKTLPTYRL